MPEREISERGGAVRWRTVRTGDGKYLHIAVVRKAGPRGGHTVAGPVHTRKRQRARTRPSTRSTSKKG